MKEQFLGSLNMPTTLKQTEALETWCHEWLPILADACNSITGIGTLWVAAEACVEAVQQLKGIFDGRSRAQIAQAVLVVVVKAATPDEIEPWLLPFLEGEGCAALIEAAFQRLFPASA